MYVYEQPFDYYYGRVLKSSLILCSTTDDTHLITHLQDLQALMSLLERDELQMHFFSYYIFNAASLLCHSVYNIEKGGWQISAQEAISWAVGRLSASSSTAAMAEAVRQCVLASVSHTHNDYIAAPEENGENPKAPQGAQVTEIQHDGYDIMELDGPGIGFHVTGQYVTPVITANTKSILRL